MEQIKHSPNHDEMIPLKFYLSQNYPNPFKEKTRIKYCVPYKTEILIEILNPEGDIIKRILDEKKEAGTYEIEYSKHDLKEGYYFYRLTAGKYRQTKKMIVQK